MPDQDPSHPQSPPVEDVEMRGLTKDFAAYSELERERQRNSLDDFDARLFDEAVELVKKKLHISPDS